MARDDFEADEMDVGEDDYNAEEAFIREVEARVRRMMKIAMALRGKSVESVAKEMRVNPEYLRKVLDGSVEIPVGLIGSMAYVLDFSVDFMLRVAGECPIPTRISLAFGN